LFTGIIEEVGILKNKYSSKDSFQLEIGTKKVVKDLTRGESIAVNGVCLTVISYTDSSFTADVMPETLRKTNLEVIKQGNKLNLELPLKPEDFMGGHLVSGHIDGIGIVNRVQPEENAKILEVEFDSELNKFMVDKGSVALNGVSLTVMELSKNMLKVSLIPETMSQTNLKFINPGEKVNIETDLIGKYVVKLWDNYRNKDFNPNSKIDKNFLEEKGFF